MDRLLSPMILVWSDALGPFFLRFFLGSEERFAEPESEYSFEHTWLVKRLWWAEFERYG